MKKKVWSMLPVILLASIVISGCEAIGSIFKAGVWTGIIGVLLLVGIIIFIVAKLFSKNKNG